MENKRCPFCGDEMGMGQEYGDQHGYWPFCLNSDCIMHNPTTDQGMVSKSYRTREEAIDAWNTRPIESAMLARAEKAEAALREAVGAMIDAYPDIFGGYNMRDAIAKAEEVLNETAMP